MKCDGLKSVYIDRAGDWCRSGNDTGKFYLKEEVDAAIAELKEAIRIKDKLLIENGKQIGELKGELESRRQAAIDIKLSAEKVLRDLLDCGLIKEWYFNGKFNAVLKADDPHLQIAELKTENLSLKAKNIELQSFYDLHGNVDNYIDKLKAENKLLKEHIANGDVSRITWIDEVIELKKKLESVQASMYCDVVDANMEVRRLKRALFIAHAIKAKFKWWWMSECKHNESCKLLPDTRKIKKFTNCAWICSKSQDKCRAKAEEYK